MEMLEPSSEKSSASKVRPHAPNREEGGSKAQLLSLQMTDFKCFGEKFIEFKAGDCTCIVGPNSSGKSSIVDAIKFLVLHPDSRQPRSLVRRCRPAVSRCCVSAVFETEQEGKVVLRREVYLEGPTEHRLTFAMQVDDEPLEELTEARYAAGVENLLGQRDGNIFLEQFSLMRENDAKNLLKILPQALEQYNMGSTPRPPMLKRSKSSNLSSTSSGLTNTRTNVEAWVSRRLDEIYRELSKEPLDENFETWSDGGQACLRRLQDGSFTIFVSRRRGLAALGHGSPLESLSDGDRDLCALALLLTLTRLKNASLNGEGLTDAFPDFVILDDPDSRLDKRAACCLLQLLSGPSRPKQCLITSLNNHKAFASQPTAVVLPELAIEQHSALTSSQAEGHISGDVQT